MLEDVRCECGKIVCQSDPDYIVVKCRHCKRYMFIKKEKDKNNDFVTASFSHLANRVQANIHEHIHSYGKHS